MSCAFRYSVIIGLVALMLLPVAIVYGQGVPQPVLDPAAGFTTYAIPRTTTPPVLDGKLAPGEWDNACLLNVMTDQSTRWQVLFPRWVKWRLLWDADYLYLCSESQRLTNEMLVCNERDQTLGGNTVMDDSIEVHFTPGGRNAAGAKLPWAAQAIINPLCVGYYSKFTWAVAARTTAWVPDWKFGSNITPQAWTIEIAVPRTSVDLDAPNKPGDPWSILLARNWKRTGWNQSTLPCKLSGFQVPREHPAAFLTDGAYARLEDTAALFKGDLRPALMLGTCGTTPEKVTVSLQVENVKDAAAFRWEKNETLDVAPGKPIPWAVADAPQELPAGDYRYYLKVTAASTAQPVLETNFFFTPGSDGWLATKEKALVPESYAFSAQLAPSKSMLLVSADFLNAPKPGDVAKLEVTVEQAGAKLPLFTGNSTNIEQAMIRTTFQLPELAPGKYTWTMRLKDQQGGELAKKNGEIEKKDEAKAFPWWDFTGSKIDRVLAPYEPIRVENGGAHAGYWGGEYYLNGLCLPRQVQVTANQECWPALLRDRPSVLAREIELIAEQQGKPVPVIMQGFPRTTRSQEWEAALRGRGQIGDSVEVQSDAVFAQDGLLWITLTLRPSLDAANGKDERRTEAKLDRLTIDIPLREEVARSLVAHGTPGYGSFTIGAVPEGKGVVWNCTQIGRSVLTAGNLLPLVWVGNDQRGLTFLSESNKGWAPTNVPDQQLIRNPGEVVLRLNVIQEPITLTGDRSFSFGFLPTPMHKMLPGWRMLNTSFSQNFADSFNTGRDPAKGATYNASFMPYSYQKSRDLMFRNTENMLTYPGGNEFAPHTERGGYETVSRDWDALGYFGPEWMQNTWTPAFQRHLLWNLQQWIDEGGMTGIYHDQFSPHPTTNAITGAAYTLPDGRTNRGYNMLLDRTYNMREYALFQENGIEPRIFCHTTNGGQLISYPWVTAVLDGEDNFIVSNAEYDFADIYPPARMQAYGNPWNWGNTFYWMRLIQNGTPEWQKKQDRAYQGWTILHDVMYANGVEGLRPAFFDWGMNDRRVQFWPYWRMKGLLQCSNPDVLVSMWTLPDRVLVLAFNTGKAAAFNTTLRLPLADLGLMPKVRSEYLTAYDIEKGQLTFDAWNGALTVNIPPHDFRVVAVRKYQD